jgi:hypothetical protein
MARVEPAQAAFHGAKHMVIAEVIARRITRLGIVLETDAAFGLNDDRVADAWKLLQHLAKHCFGFAIGVDIRMIEEGDALVDGHGDDVGGSGPFGATERGTIPVPTEFEAPITDARHV